MNEWGRQIGTAAGTHVRQKLKSDTLKEGFKDLFGALNSTCLGRRQASFSTRYLNHVPKFARRCRVCVCVILVFDSINYC